MLSSSFSSGSRSSSSWITSGAPPLQSSLSAYADRASWLSTSSPSLRSTTQYTVTSSRTILGPGALTGKALRRLGKAAINGYEQIVIRRRLTAIALHFPHTDHHAARIPGIEKMYEDILELSRPGMYTKEIRVRALRMLLGQIRNCQTRTMINVLSRWDADRMIELQLLLYELISQDSQIWSSPERLEDTDAASVGRTRPNTLALPPDFWPLILFISEIIRISAASCQAVLDAGYLDAIDAMCQTDFRTLFATSLHIPQHLRIRLRIACAISLIDIIAYPEFRPTVAQYSVGGFWMSPARSINPEMLVGFTNFLVDGRETLYMDEQSPYLYISIADLCAMECVSEMSPEALLSSLTTHVTHKQALRVYLSRASHVERVALFHGFIDYLSSITSVAGFILSFYQLKCSRVHSETDRKYSEVFYELPSYAQLLLFLQLVSSCARMEYEYVSAFNDAGIIPFLIHILASDIRLHIKLAPQGLDIWRSGRSAVANVAETLQSRGHRRLREVMTDELYDGSDVVKLVCEILEIV